jgi:hypothetical protein
MLIEPNITYIIQFFEALNIVFEFFQKNKLNVARATSVISGGFTNLI